MASFFSKNDKESLLYHFKINYPPIRSTLNPNQTI